MDDRKREAVLRRMAEHGGLKIECLGCGARGRHLPGMLERLRDRQCRRCGTKHPRVIAWLKRNPEKAAKLRALAQLGVFEGTSQ